MPSYAIGVIVLLYWGYVVAKLIRVRRRARWRQAAIPSQPLERVMWVVWIPLIVMWIALPFVSANQSPERYPWLTIPNSMSEIPLLALRWFAVLLAVGAFVASLSCWRFMGRYWRMAVDENMTTLLTTGPFRRVRHPIYSLSILLMMCTAVVVPSRVMLAVAVVHFMLLVLKTVNEERFMRRAHGQVYEAYSRRAGRFLPRWTGRTIHENMP